MKELLEANKMIRAAAIYELTDPEALKLYEAARKRELDYKSRISAAERRGEERGEKRGIQKGIQEGIQIGRQEGIQIGRQEGRLEERQLVINKLLKKGYILDEIQEMTGYTLDEIQKVTGVTKTQIKELQERNRSNK